ncbi:Chromo domain [Dillenia turbinata]|uniref:Chromo domain n=1 Tax=Dillenia turbinata TaxID=194707 RepID=A0AAN8UYE1_9MAGN
MKQVADTERREVHFQVGDLIYLKLHPYRHQSVFRKAYQKLASRYYGPYRVEAKIGQKSGDTNVINSELPPLVDEGAIIVEPETILDTRWVKKGSSFVEKKLVKWKKLAAKDATWENAREFEDKFLNVNLEDKVQEKGGGIDKPRRSKLIPIKNPKFID